MEWIGTAVGALGGLFGSRSSARRSQRQAREQMAFQERMSNTAYSRAAKDLEAAGLNRILALGSPASTPGGAQGTVPDFGQAASSGAQAGTAAMLAKTQGRLNNASAKKVAQDTATGVAQENLLEAQQAETLARTRLNNANAQYIENSRVKPSEGFLRFLEAAGTWTGKKAYSINEDLEKIFRKYENWQPHSYGVRSRSNARR